MTLKIITQPATEPLSVSEVKAFLRIDDGNQEPAPGALTAALISPAESGNVDNGAHRYRVTFTTSNGETEGGTISSSVTVANKTTNGKIAITSIPLGGALVTGRKLYRTAANGTSYFLLATIADNTTTTYTDNTADASLGAEAPSINTTDDPLLGMLITAARIAAEMETRRALITQTIDLYLDAFSDEIKLPPIQSVTSITYVDLAGDTQTISAADYIVDSKSEPCRITPAYSLSWPSTREQTNAVTVRFVAGYGAAADVPAGIKNWMLMRIATLWETRTELMIDARGMVQIPASFIDGLLDPYRVQGRI